MQARRRRSRAQQLSRALGRDPGRERADKARRVYYLSMEFLIGRTLSQRARRAGPARRRRGGAGARTRQRSKTWPSSEPDAALGNGGLGRLAACFLDSMATLGLPSFGYGIRYEYGMFAQEIDDGRQVEHPDPWLADGTPWEFPRAGVTLPGALRRLGRARGEPARAVAPRRPRSAAKAYDMVVPGPRHAQGQHAAAVEGGGAGAHRPACLQHRRLRARRRASKNEYENISWVLYPNDSTPAGRELRLRQEYFFVGASMQDIARHATSTNTRTLDNLADKVAIHLNDTHPAIGVRRADAPAVRRARHAPGRAPGRCAGSVFSYTNHTLMPEALETWPVGADAARAAAPPGDHLPHQPGVPRPTRARSGPGDDRASCAACR